MEKLQALGLGRMDLKLCSASYHVSLDKSLYHSEVAVFLSLKWRSSFGSFVKIKDDSIIVLRIMLRM